MTKMKKVYSFILNSLVKGYVQMKTLFSARKYNSCILKMARLSRQIILLN